MVHHRRRAKLWGTCLHIWIRQCAEVTKTSIPRLRMLASVKERGQFKKLSWFWPQMPTPIVGLAYIFDLPLFGFRAMREWSCSITWRGIHCTTYMFALVTKLPDSNPSCSYRIKILNENDWCSILLRKAFSSQMITTEICMTGYPRT